MKPENEMPLDSIERFKKQVQHAYQYWKPNYDRYNEVRSFVFATTISPMDSTTTESTQRPVLECPILEPMISRLCEEFFKNRPDPKVSGAPGRPEDPEQIRVIEGIIRYLDDEMNVNHNVDYRVIEDIISGGFSAAKVYEDYAAEKGPNAFDLTIKTELTFNPSMTYWDPNSREDDKRDGNYCGEIFPLYEEDYKEQFPDSPIGDMKFDESVQGFHWSYKNLDKKIILVVEHYVKEFKTVEILKLADGKVITRQQYNKLQKRSDTLGIMITPTIVEKRKARHSVIMKYTFNGEKILREEETDYDNFPIIYADGNSKLIKDTTNGSAIFMTRPLIYPAMDVQRLKNVAMQSIANELENVQQSQFMFPKEAIPTQNIDEWTSPQLAASLPYNQFLNNDPNVPLNKPEVVFRRPFPPEYIQIFKECDMAVQQVFGSFQPALAKIGDHDISGKAIRETLDVSNSASAPYFINYIKYKQAWCNRVLEMLPKIYPTARSIPIINEKGEREYVMINQQGGISLQYDPTAMNVKVIAGANFKIQKERAYDAIIRTMQISPEFASFMNSKGLLQLLDNMPEIRGIEALKKAVGEWQQEMQEMKQKQMQAQQMQMQSQQEQIQAQTKQLQSRSQLEEEKLRQDIKQQQIENRLEMAQLLLDKQRLEIELEEARSKIEIEADKAQADKIISAAEIAIKRAEQQIKVSSERQKQLDLLINYEVEARYLDLENKKLENSEEKDGKEKEQVT